MIRSRSCYDKVSLLPNESRFNVGAKEGKIIFYRPFVRFNGIFMLHPSANPPHFNYPIKGYLWGAFAAAIVNLTALQQASKPNLSAKMRNFAEAWRTIKMRCLQHCLPRRLHRHPAGEATFHLQAQLPGCGSEAVPGADHHSAPLGASAVREREMSTVCESKSFITRRNISQCRILPARDPEKSGVLSAYVLWSSVR